MKNFACKAAIILISALCMLSADAQNNYVDSLKKVLQTGTEDTSRILTLIEMSWEISDSKASMQYAAEGLALANKLNYNKGKARAYNRIGKINYDLGNDSIALKNYFIALKIRKQINDVNGIWGSLLNIGDLYIKENNLAEAKKYYQEGLQIARKHATVDQLLNQYLETSNAYNRMHYYTEAVNNMQLVIEFYRKTKDKSALAGAYSFLATIYVFQYNYPEAVENFNNGFKLYNEIGDKKDAANMLQYIGKWYEEMGNDSDAIKYLLASVKMREKVDDKPGAAMSHVTMSGIYANKGRYNKAFTEINEALRLYQQSGMPGWGAPMCISIIGGLNEKLGDSAAAKGNKSLAAIKYSIAENYYTIGLQKSKEINYREQIAEGYSGLGAIQLKLKNLPIARTYLDSSLKLSLEFDNKRLLKECYQNLSNLDSLEGNYSQAYFHYKKYISYRDSLNTEENTKKFVQIKMQTEFDQKQTLAKAEQAKKDAETKRVKNQQYFAITALGVIVLAILIIALIQFRNNKQKQQANIVLKQQKEKVESTLSELKSTQAQLIQSEKMASLGELTAGIAHEIQNPLNFVNNFSDVNKEMLVELNDEIEKGNYADAKAIAKDVIANEEKINHHGKRADAIVKSMMQHSRQTKGVKEPTDINALCDEYLRLSYHGLRAKDKNFNANFKTDFDETISKINVVPQDIGRVLLNLFNNAFYAVNEKSHQLSVVSYQPAISVQTKKLINKVEIVVGDNGNGIPQNIIDKIFQPFFTTKPTGQGTGLGLSLAYDIITKEHNGNIKVESKEGERSVFKIQIPVL